MIIEVCGPFLRDRMNWFDDEEEIDGGDYVFGQTFNVSVEDLEISLPHVVGEIGIYKNTAAGAYEIRDGLYIKEWVDKIYAVHGVNISHIEEMDSILTTDYKVPGSLWVGVKR